MIKNQYIVVDDFYDDPEVITAFIAQSETEEASAGNYSGVMTKIALYTDTHAAIFKSLTGGIDLFPTTQLTGKFRFTTANDTVKQDIHFDPAVNNMWSSVIYLGKEPEGCTQEDLNSYGTHFWRHNKTGLTSIPLTQEGIEKYGWKGVPDLKVFLETEGCDHSLWTKVFTVPYKYNRLVMFRPWLFHSPGTPFGTDKTNCRIVQTFFLGPNNEI